MLKIEDFAFCFFSSDIDVVIEQEKELTKLSSKYNIERWYRYNRNIGKYVSFSQMINDAIDDTDSEFMIFCNPKTNFKSEDIEFIIDKLSNGYCFASVVNYGFVGFSKELIRRVGMFDENFLGGEWEDNDFTIRLSNFGKAVYLDYDKNKYEETSPSRAEYRGFGYSFFHQKYKIENNIIYINENLYKHKKISKRHNKKKQFIFDSWLDKEHSEGNCVNVKYLKMETIFTKPNFIEKNVEFSFHIDRKPEEIKIDLICNEDITLNYMFLTNIDQGRHMLWSGTIRSYMYNTVYIYNGQDIEIKIFSKDFQIYNTLIKPIDNLEIKFNLPIMVEI